MSIGIGSLFLFLLFSGEAGIATAEAPRRVGCDTPTPSECERVLMWLVDRRWEASQEEATGAGRERVLATEKAYDIPVVFHLLAPTDKSSTTGDLTKRNRRKLIAALNDGFEDTPFAFNYQETITTHNDAYHRCDNSQVTFKKELRVGGKTVLNVFLADTRRCRTMVARGGYAYKPLVGSATFPHELTQLASGSLPSGKDLDGVLLRNPSDSLLRELPSSEVPGGVDAIDFDDVLAAFVHEVGHWLGLLHTFEGECSGNIHTNVYPDGAIGDGVDDTPAEKQAAWESVGWDSCFEGEGATIPNTCAEENDSPDPVDNFMNYNHHECVLKKKGKFTSGQIDRMVSQFEAFRLENIPRGASKSTRRFLEDAAGADGEDSFVPANDLIEVCVASAVTECNCLLPCYFKFRDLLVEFLPFDKLNEMTERILDGCNECGPLGSTEGCPTGQFCGRGYQRQDFSYDVGAAVEIGHRCVTPYKTMSNENRYEIGRERCWRDNQCLKGQSCQNGFCAIKSECKRGGLGRGCRRGEICRAVKKCDAVVGKCLLTHECKPRPKLELGRSCVFDNECRHRKCTAGKCSLCRQIESEDECDPGKKCRKWMRRSKGKRKRESYFFRCAKEPYEARVWGSLCSSSVECFGMFCVDGQCRECPRIGAIDGCYGWGYCDQDYSCRQKHTPHGNSWNSSTSIIPCWNDDMCAGGACHSGMCLRCPVDGPCKQSKDGGFGTCVGDHQCASKDCRNGACYGDCTVNDVSLCWQSSQCVDQFCFRGSFLGTKQDYFLKYDSRVGEWWYDSKLCAANWQCDEGMWCDKRKDRGTCVAKRRDGAACHLDAACISGDCKRKPGKSGTCAASTSTQCTGNADCNSLQYCAGFECRNKGELGAWCRDNTMCLSNLCGLLRNQCESCETLYKPDENCMRQDPNKPICIEGDHLNRCVQCDVDGHCDSNQFCTGSYGSPPNVCVEKKCETNEDCDELGQFCDASGLGRYSCVDCRFDFDCLDPALPTCEYTSNTCVQCRWDENCPEGLYCNELNQCSECVLDIHCPEDKICDSETYTCVNGTSTEGCRKDDDCILFHCQLDSGTCFCDDQEGCRDNERCHPYASGCHPRDCLDDAECPNQQICTKHGFCGCYTNAECDEEAGEFCTNHVDYFYDKVCEKRPE